MRSCKRPVKKEILQQLIDSWFDLIGRDVMAMVVICFMTLFQNLHDGIEETYDRANENQ
jgi:hypothetical protein